MQKQVFDNPGLLKLMLEDSKSVPEIYKTTNYWAYNTDKFIAEILEKGLKDFRQRHGSKLGSFGATDLTPEFMIDLRSSTPIFSNRIINKLPFRLALLTSLNHIIEKMIGLFPSYYRYVKNTPYLMSKVEGEKAGAKPVAEFEASLVGNPEDVITVNGKTYTTSILYYYLRYAYCTRFINFDDITILVELGSGCGKQVEVIKKLHPDICFYIFEIPPQLYVCEQYLTSIFPESVVSYKQTRDINTPTIEKGKIFIFGNWKFPIIENVNIDLFWNAASFQEMEPDVVSNYLKFVNTQAKNVYLFEKMDGKETTTELKGGGVLKKTIMWDYINGLTDFKLVDLSRPIFPKHKLIVSPFYKKGVNAKTVEAYPEYPSVNKKQAISSKDYHDSFWIHV
jgi:putative sugar O-methyltransferase